VKAVLDGGAGLLVRKLGAAGVEAFSRETSASAPPITVPVGSTIGAGDGFASGFLAALLDGPAARRLPAPRQRGGRGGGEPRELLRRHAVPARSGGDACPRLRSRACTCPRATPQDGGDPVLVTPAVAGWAFSGLRVMRLGAGASRAIDTGPNEMVVLPLSGSAVVRVDGQRLRLEGRTSVFDRVSDFAYLPRDTRFEIESDSGGEFALPMAQARRRLEPAYGPAERVPVEIRGAGDATRQVTNFCTPGSFATDRLSAVRAHHAGGELVVLPAPQARRGARGRGHPRGDLLLPDPRAPPASPCIAPTPRTAPST
jgi:hypothetical protein